MPEKQCCDVCGNIGVEDLERDEEGSAMAFVTGDEVVHIRLD